MFPPSSKILVIDDFATMRKIVKKILGELGYSQIQEADDGKPAFEMLKKAADENQPFQVVISDWNMPGMTGIDLLKQCKADSSLRDTPFMLVTAENEQKHILEAAKAGVSDYVVKPFNAQTLKEKLAKVHTKHFGKKVA
jgi:two-component system chemotaxis response regulator CheY